MLGSPGFFQRIIPGAWRSWGYHWDIFFFDGTYHLQSSWDVDELSSHQWWVKLGRFQNSFLPILTIWGTQMNSSNTNDLPMSSKYRWEVPQMKVSSCANHPQIMEGTLQLWSFFWRESQGEPLREAWLLSGINWSMSDHEDESVSWSDYLGATTCQLG